MADEKKADPRAEKRKKLYDSRAAKQARGESDSAQVAEDTGQKPTDKTGGGDTKVSTVKTPGEGDKPKPDGNASEGSAHTPEHKAEMTDMMERHEKERRDLHGTHRDGFRTMNARHLKELAGAADGQAMTSMHRKFEAEYQDMGSAASRAMTEMFSRHTSERRDMFGRHEGGAAKPAEGAEGGKPEDKPAEKSAEKKE